MSSNDSPNRPARPTLDPSTMHPAFPLLHLALEQPELLIEHAAAYSALLASESADAMALLERRLLLRLLAFLALAVALILAGMALMLALVLPNVPDSVWLPWVPLPALLGAAAAWWASRRLEAPTPVADLLEQVQIDYPSVRSPAAFRGAP